MEQEASKTGESREKNQEFGGKKEETALMQYRLNIWLI